MSLYRMVVDPYQEIEVELIPRVGDLVILYGDGRKGRSGPRALP